MVVGVERERERERERRARGGGMEGALLYLLEFSTPPVNGWRVGSKREEMSRCTGNE